MKAALQRFGSTGQTDKLEERAEKRFDRAMNQAATKERRALRAAAAAYKARTDKYTKAVAKHNLRGKQSVLKRKQKTAKNAKQHLKKQRKLVTVVETLKF